MARCKTSRKQKKLLGQERRRERQVEGEARAGELDIRRMENDTMIPEPAATTIFLSEEELFKQKHAAEFEDTIEESSGGHVQVKSEPAEEDRTSRPQSETLAAPISSAVIADAERDRPTSRIGENTHILEAASPNDHQKVLDTILSHKFSAEMTQPAIQQVLQDAREYAKWDNEFGIAHIEAQIDRLQHTNTSLPRLTEVIKSFQIDLRSRTQQLLSRIDDLANRSMATAPSTNSIAPDHADRSKRKHSFTNSSDKDAQPAASRSKTTHAGSIEDHQSRSEFFEGAHGRSENSSPCGNDAGKDVGTDEVNSRRSKYMSDDDEDYMEDKDGSDIIDEERSMLYLNQLIVRCWPCLLTLLNNSEH